MIVFPWMRSTRKSFAHEALRNDELRYARCSSTGSLTRFAYSDEHFATKRGIAAEAGLDFAVHAQTHVSQPACVQQGHERGEARQHGAAPFVRKASTTGSEHHINEFDKFSPCSLQRRCRQPATRCRSKPFNPVLTSPRRLGRSAARTERH